MRATADQLVEVESVISGSDASVCGLKVGDRLLSCNEGRGLLSCSPEEALNVLQSCEDNVLDLVVLRQAVGSRQFRIHTPRSIRKGHSFHRRQSAPSSVSHSSSAHRKRDIVHGQRDVANKVKNLAQEESEEMEMNETDDVGGQLISLVFSNEDGEHGLGLGGGEFDGGVFITSIDQNGAAWNARSADHKIRLEIGDRLLEANGKSLLSASKEEALAVLEIPRQFTHLVVLRLEAKDWADISAIAHNSSTPSILSRCNSDMDDSLIGLGNVSPQANGARTTDFPKTSYNSLSNINNTYFSSGLHVDNNSIPADSTSTACGDAVSVTNNTPNLHSGDFAPNGLNDSGEVVSVALDSGQNSGGRKGDQVHPMLSRITSYHGSSPDALFYPADRKRRMTAPYLSTDRIMSDGLLTSSASKCPLVESSSAPAPLSTDEDFHMKNTDSSDPMLEVSPQATSRPSRPSRPSRTSNDDFPEKVASSNELQSSPNSPSAKLSPQQSRQSLSYSKIAMRITSNAKPDGSHAFAGEVDARGLMVTEVEEGSSVWQQGLYVGTCIVSMNGQSTLGLPQEAANTLMESPELDLVVLPSYDDASMRGAILIVDIRAIPPQSLKGVKLVGGINTTYRGTFISLCPPDIRGLRHGDRLLEVDDYNVMFSTKPAAEDAMRQAKREIIVYRFPFEVNLANFSLTTMGRVMRMKADQSHSFSEIVLRGGIDTKSKGVVVKAVPHTCTFSLLPGDLLLELNGHSLTRATQKDARALAHQTSFVDDCVVLRLGKVMMKPVL